MSEIIDVVEPSVPGPRGPAGTFSEATAIALPTGSAPTVDMSGPETDRHIEFGIPAGPRGPKGDPGDGSVNSVNGDLGPDVVITAPGIGAATAQDMADLKLKLELRTPVSVKEFGAKGDGVTDDTQAFTDALAAINSAGGGTLLVPPATYVMSGWARIYSNTTVSGYGATIIKGASASATMCFGILSAGKKGYGSGARRVSFLGLTFRGSFATNRRIGILGANHGDDILIQDCDFIEAHIEAHIADLGGCRRVTVSRCNFIGSKINSPANAYNECIQADNSTRFGSSVLDSPGSYDGLPSSDISVVDSSFLPLTIAGVNYPAPIPFGSHYGIAGTWHERLSFISCTVIDPPTDTASAFRGVLHFVGARDITIEKCVFETTASANSRIIANIPLTTTIDIADVESSSPTTKPLAVPVQSTGWTIRDNVFKGFKASADPQSLILLRGTSAASRGGSALIEGNKFYDCYGTDLTSGSGPIVVDAYACDDLTIVSNRLRNVRNLVSFGGGGGSERVVVSGNTVDGASATSVVTCDGAKSVSILGNVFRRVGTAINASSAATEVTILGNTVASRGAGIVVGSGTSRVTTVGNTSISETGANFTLLGTNNVAANNNPST